MPASSSVMASRSRPAQAAAKRSVRSLRLSRSSACSARPSQPPDASAAARYSASVRPGTRPRRAAAMVRLSRGVIWYVWQRLRTVGSSRSGSVARKMKAA